MRNQPASDRDARPARRAPSEVATQSSRPSVEAKLDLVGGGLVLITAAWWQLAPAEGSNALPLVGLLAAAAGAYLVALVLARFFSPLVPAALVVAGVVAALVMSTESDGPLGYENANAILFALAGIAALMMWSAAPARASGILSLGVALVLGLIPLMVGAVAAAAVFVLGGAIAIVALLGRSRGALATAGVVFALVLVSTIALGATYSGNAGRLGSALSERRLELWHDALVIVGDHPLAGAGLDRFEELSPTARSDPDARWAHNEFLQVGAETGVPGLLLLTSLFVWGFARLAAEPGSPHRAIAAAALAAVGIAASIDYVFHFAAVPITAAALLGTGVAYRRPDREGSPVA
jgi:O-antigen ligase